MSTLGALEDHRAKGWTITLTGDGDGWHCLVVGRLAHGGGYAKTIEEAGTMAMANAHLMEDDPAVLIKKHGRKVKAMIKEIFGEKVFQSLEPVRWETSEPLKIAINVKPKDSDHKKYVEKEVEFIKRSTKELPREVWTALVFEVDWPDERGGR